MKLGKYLVSQHPFRKWVVVDDFTHSISGDDYFPALLWLKGNGEEVGF